MSATPDGADPALLALRTQIDAVDRELLACLNRRAGLALAVGEIKKREGTVVFRPEREAQVIDGLKAVNAGPLIDPKLQALQQKVRGAFTGADGAAPGAATGGASGAAAKPAATAKPAAAAASKPAAK